MKKVLLAISTVLVMIFLLQQAATAQNDASKPTSEVIYPSAFSETKPLSEILKEHPYVEEKFDPENVWVSKDRKNRPHQTFIYSSADGPEYGNDPSIIQNKMGFRDLSSKATIQNWAGVTSTSYPPDPTGAVGPNHYIQSVNATTVRIFNKTGTVLSTFLMGTLWGLSSNAGDPIILYDKFADRWFLSQFGSSNEIYIAISKTADPTGAYYTYTYTSPQFPDYLKFSIWADGYYMTSNQATDKVYVFERDQMLIGNAAARGIFTTYTTGSVSPFFVPLPADAGDNLTLPAAGTPFPFFSYYDNAWGGGTDGIKIWNMTTNWTTGTATISASTQVNTNAFDASYNASWDDCPQPNGQYLDGIGGVLTFRAPWRSWASYNSVVMCWGILITNSPRQRAIYWCELRQTAGTWSVYQQGIYNPDAATRWMGSIAMDNNGSIGLAYAKSSTSIYPGLFYTGRLAGDPLGTMTFAETQAVAGTGSQSTYNRFGDYSQTALDPDGITFWHTGEYVLSGAGQETRIFSFQLPAGPLAPVANFTVDKAAPFCSGTVQFTDQSSNTPTSWLWNFGDSQTSTLQSPSHTYAASGTYTVSLKATNATGNNTLTKTSYITIALPTSATATGAARCGTGTVTLTASGANTLKWYAGATGGTTLGTGTSFTTPSISATTTYYVENNIPEANQNVGPAVAGSSSTAASYLIFDVSEEMTLVSIQAQRQSSSSVVIELQNSAGTTLQTTTATIGTTPTTVTLNWLIPVGTAYRLVTPTSSRLLRMTSGVSYPYTLAGLVSITGCSAGTTTYSSYFNWTVQGSGCASARTPVVATINSTVTPAISVAATATTICSGTSVTYTATPSNGGTPTYQWKLNGTNVGGNSATYSNASTAQGDVITCVMTSTASCASPTTATSNSVTMTVNPAVTPSVLVAASATTICAGTSVTFTPTPTNGGTPSYQWKRNGTNVGTGSTYTSTTLAQGDIITCVMTSNASCVSPATATSNAVTMTVNPLVTPAIAIAASATTICSGTSVTFTPSPTNGGTPTYQWKLNGVNAGTGSTYTSAALTQGDQVNCVMTSTETCAAFPTAISNTVNMTVNPAVTPAVAISATGTVICAGTSVSFTATPTNGGSPTYQWKLNGTNAGTGIATYTNAGLAQGDVVTCVMTSTASCASPAIATSNPVTMTVNPALTPAVGISASASSICTGTSVTFTAAPTNGGTPSYQWKKNGTNAGTGSTYTSTTLAQGDVITCVMTSNASCVSPTTATSNAVTMTVSSSVTPAVAIAASATTICSGTSVTFTPTPTNGGTPTYQWKLNGVNAGTGSTYTSAALAQGDVVTCVMTSTETCASVPTATSNSVNMTVNPSVTPAVAIAATGTVICAGTSVNFTATPTNGGTPTYQWTLNDINVGTNSNTYTNAALVSGDYVKCTLTSTASCATPATVTSLPISITVKPLVVPAVSIASSSSTICTGVSVTFTATPANGGTPVYQWELNGTNVGTNSNTYTSNSLAQGDQVICSMTSTESCAIPTTAQSNAVVMTVNSSLTPAVAINASATNICSGTNVTFTASPTNGGIPSYQWLVNGSNVGSNSDTYSSNSLNTGDLVSCVMSSSLACASPLNSTSNTVSITVSSAIAPAVAINASSTIICSGTSVVFDATPTNGGTPTYQWLVNGSNVGTNNQSFATSGLNNGDVVTCVMGSSLGCASPASATSNPVSITVNNQVTPSVGVNASATSICIGTMVSFTATPTNGGTPTYQWMVNGSNAGNNSASFSSNSLSDNDVVSCIMTSSSACASPTAATSNSVTISVNSTVTPLVIVGASGTTICSGSPVTFNATAINGGSPMYQWLLNGNPVGSNSAIYTNTALANNDDVSCQMTSNAACASPATVTSNEINIVVKPNLTPSVLISSSPAGPVCPGTTKLFTPVPTNGGNNPTYTWTVDGSIVSAGPSYSGVFTDGQIILCTMTSDADCINPMTADAMPITISIFAVSPVVVTESAGTLTSSAANGNQWFEQTDGIIPGAVFQTYTPTANGNYYCVVTDANDCQATSNIFNLTMVGMNENSDSPLVTFFPNPTDGLVEITFGQAVNNGKLIIENAIGQKIYEEALDQPLNSSKTIDLSTYAVGVYFIIVRDAKLDFKQKVLFDK